MNYFVSVTAGLDTNDGSELHPFRTIQKAASLAQETVFIEGGTYHELIKPKYSGNSTLPITYKNYKSVKPVIDGADLPASGFGVFSLYALHDVTLDGLEICNCKDFAGIYAGTYGAGATGGFKFKNLTIHDTWNSGILMNSSWSFPITTKMKNVTIYNCHLYRTNIGGSNESISLIGVDGFEVYNCLIHDVQGHQNYPNDKEGIDCKEGTSNGSLHDNEVYNSKVGIYIGGSNTPQSNIRVYRNKLHHNYDMGIGIGSEGACKDTTGISILNNLIYHNRYNGFSVLDYPATIGFEFSNNTLYGHEVGRETYLTKLPKYTKCKMYGNIVLGTNSLGTNLSTSGVTIANTMFGEL